MSQFFFNFLFRSEWSSQVGCMIWMNLTPRSIMRRASRQLVANGRVTSLLIPYISRVAGVSLEKSRSSGPADCIRNANSYDAMRDAISMSPARAKFCWLRSRMASRVIRWSSTSIPARFER